MLLSTDVFTLIDENAIVPLDDLSEGKSWFKEFYPFAPKDRTAITEVQAKTAALMPVRTVKSWDSL